MYRSLDHSGIRITQSGIVPQYTGAIIRTVYVARVGTGVGIFGSESMGREARCDKLRRSRAHQVPGKRWLHAASLVKSARSRSVSVVEVGVRRSIDVVVNVRSHRNKNGVVLVN